MLLLSKDWTLDKAAATFPFSLSCSAVQHTGLDDGNWGDQRERAVHVMSNSIEGIVGKVSGVIESDRERERERAEWREGRPTYHPRLSGIK